MPLEALRYPVTPVGLHYLLIHYDVPAVEPEGWRLTVRGERELELSLDELRARPAAEQTVTMECAGNGRARLEPRPVSQPWILEAVGTARWRGTPLRLLLEDAGVPEGTVEVLFTGLDRGIEGGDEQAFQRALQLEEALRDEVLLAYEMNGARMPPRSLFVPPGIPEFMTRERTVAAGEVPLEGRAWSGLAPVTSVEVSDDGGSTWAPAVLEPAGEPWAWRGWSYRWDAKPGEHLLCSRARDEAGNEQPVEPPWNLGGYANNAVQTVRVVVTG